MKGQEIFEQVRPEQKEEVKHSVSLQNLKRFILREPGKLSSLDQAADNLNIKPRTLRRRLAILKTTFTKELHAAMIEISKICLEESNMSMKEISLLLGYNDPSNWGKIFKKRVDIPPTYYRLNLTRNK